MWTFLRLMKLIKLSRSNNLQSQLLVHQHGDQVLRILISLSLSDSCRCRWIGAIDLADRFQYSRRKYSRTECFGWRNGNAFWNSQIRFASSTYLDIKTDRNRSFDNLCKRNLPFQRTFSSLHRFDRSIEYNLSKCQSGLTRSNDSAIYPWYSRWILPDWITKTISWWSSIRCKINRFSFLFDSVRFSWLINVKRISTRNEKQKLFKEKVMFSMMVVLCIISQIPPIIFHRFLKEWKWNQVINVCHCSHDARMYWSMALL